MSGEQYASPPCFLHELDLDFLEIESPDPKKAKKTEQPIKAETDEP